MRTPRNQSTIPSFVLSATLAILAAACATEPPTQQLAVARSAFVGAIGDTTNLAEYLNTPAGQYHRSCVHALAIGERVNARTGS